MALDNEEIVCKLLKDKWSAIKNMINAIEHLLRNLYNQLKNFFQKLKNTILRRVVQTISEMIKLLASQLNLDVVSTNKVRTSWCKVMYNCKPMLEQLTKFIGPEVFDWIYGPEKIETLDLSKYGLPTLTFTSKYEVYEYVACRLSLRGLLDQAAKSAIDMIKEWLNNALQYIDLSYWLQRTGVGRMIERRIKDYEDVFENLIKPHIMEIDKYMDCAFAICDFKASTKNFLDDFCKRYAIGQSEETVNGIVTRNYKLLRQDLLKDCETSFAATKADLERVNIYRRNVALTANEKYEKALLSKESNAETEKDRVTREYDRTQRDNANTPSLATGFNSKTRRITKELISPNSDVA